MTVETALHGWLVIDKPPGLTSNRAVSLVRRATGAKAGHAGTLDPLATGVLPVALGEATKTVDFAMAGHKTYRFRIRWGEARATDDAEGAIIGESSARPTGEAVKAVLPRFIGAIRQVPPAYSALKIAGERAYRLARRDSPPQMRERTVEIASLRLVDMPDRDHADFEAEVGRGTYIRALARDLAAALGTLGHVAALRRTAVGRFTEAQAISLDCVAAQGHSLVASGLLFPLETALADIPALALTADEAARMRHGQPVTPEDPGQRAQLRGLDDGMVVAARSGDAVVALARVEQGRLRPVRVIVR
jgi:tRNA pseudouridine55 synthase